MGGPHDRFDVASVTRETAVACLDRACALQGIHPKNEPLQLHEYSREELLPIERLLAFAQENGLRVLPIRFDWFRLLAALSKRPVLLVLKNGNVIAAEKLSISTDIVIFDPLAPADERFLVARTDLEPVWDGYALTVEPETVNRARPRTRMIASAAACGVLAATLVIFFALKESALVTRVVPTASFLSLPAERLAPGVTSNLGNEALPDFPHDALFLGDISETHGSNAREQPGLETVPGAPRNSKVSNFPAATAMTQEQELTSPTDLPRVDTEQSNLEHPAPIPDTDQNAPPTARKNAPELPQEHTVEQQLASSASSSDNSFHPQEEKAPTSPRPQPATPSPPPDMAGPLDASPPMTPSERPVLSPTPSLDNPEGASEKVKAPDTDSGGPRPPKLTSDEVKTLVARGDLMLGSGDVTSARLFYERAANAPDARAALRLGESYDPAFLAAARLNRVAGSVPLAAQWYQRAAELGAPEADTLLRALAITTGVSR